MSAINAKPFQPYTSALNTTASGGSTAYQFIQVPRNLRRSHTAERSYREMNPQETSFVYEKAPKSEALKEIVQSPYMNGKKNNNYINPTFHSSNFMNQSMEIHRPRLVERKTEAPKLQRSLSQANARGVVDIQAANPIITPREAEVSRKTETTPRTNKNADVSPKFSNAAAAEIRATEPNHPATFGRRKSSVRGSENQREEAINERERVVEAAIDRYLEICNDCYNVDMVQEHGDRRRKERQAEIELERAVMDYNNQLLRAEKEHQQLRREAVQNTSHSNFETFNQRKARLASRERDADEDVALKPHTKSLAAESLRSLQRYQSILDKMYDNSARKIDERKGDLRKSQQHNKNMIYRNEETRNEDKQNHTLVNFKVNTDKSLLDKIHDNSNNYMDSQAMERRRASEYNHRTGAQRNASRHASPMELHEDPFKQSGVEYERNGEGRGMLDRMYQNSMEYWRRQQQDLKEGSHVNRETSAYLKNRKDQDEKEILYSYRYAARNNVKSMLNSMYESDERGVNSRVNGTKNCANFNKDNGYSQESALMKSKTMENYYNSPSKKVGDTQALDYSQWTHEHSGVFSKIHSAVDQLENNRKTQILENGSIIKQQMGETDYRRRDEVTKNRQFKETPLLVCSHKANLMYCNICNRKVPMNKISKILGDYKKFMKNKNSKCTL